MCFYPEATAERCTAALLFDVDPVGLVRTRRGPSGEGGMLDQTWTDLARLCRYGWERVNWNGSLGPQQTLKKALVVPPNPRRVAA
jgi:hypothetical protein